MAADRLEMHRLRSGDPQTGPIFANAAGKPMSLGSLGGIVGECGTGEDCLPGETFSASMRFACFDMEQLQIFITGPSFPLPTLTPDQTLNGDLPRNLDW